MKRATLFHRLSVDILVYLALFCDNVRAFIKLLEATKLAIELNPDNNAFYLKLAREYLRYHGLNLDSVLASYHNLHNSPEEESRQGYCLCKDLFIPRKCSRSGCLKTFEEWNNRNDVCLYHPGRLKNSFLTCCRARSFQAEGCKRSFHNGIFHFMLHSSRKDNNDEGAQQKRKDALSLPSIGLAPASAAKAPIGSELAERNASESLKLPEIK